MPSEPDCPELAAFCPTSGATSAPSPGGNSLDTAACRQAGGSFRFLLWRDDASICDAARKLDCGRRRLVGERTLRLEKKEPGRSPDSFLESVSSASASSTLTSRPGPRRSPVRWRTYRYARRRRCEIPGPTRSRSSGRASGRRRPLRRLLFAQVGTDHQLVPAVAVGMRIDPTLSVPRRGQGSRLAPGRPAMPTGRGERLVSKTEATCAKIATRK